MPEFGSRYPLLLEEVAEQVEAKLVGYGIDRARADRIAADVAEHLRGQLGGSWHYIPRGHHYEITLRDREIYAQFKGHNLREIAAAYGITLTRMYQIIQAARTEIRARRSQPIDEG